MIQIPFANLSRNSRRMNFPLALRGSASSSTQTWRGTL
jgi:hypothetical protein